MQIDFVLDVQVGPPMAHLCKTAVFGNFKYGEIVVEVDSHSLLVLVNEISVCGRSDVIVRSVGNSCS